MIKFKAKTANGEIINSALSPFTFPAGEAHTKREDRRDLEATEIAVILADEDIHQDLFQLAMWNSYITIENADLHPERHSKKVLVIPYFPGARADRGQPFGLKVYADFIRNLDLDQIILFDPHSGLTGDQLHAAANTVTIVRPHELLNTNQTVMRTYTYDGIIAPDKGAVQRAQGVADALGLPLYTAEKTRDFETGKLSGFSIEMPDEGLFLIVDDICDGGGTFLGLAGAINPERILLDLYVSHGVFSKNALNSLPLKFDRIYTTNSYRPDRFLNGDLPGHPFIRIDVLTTLLKKVN